MSVFQIHFIVNQSPADYENGEVQPFPPIV